MKKNVISSLFNLVVYTLILNAQIVNVNTGLEYSTIQSAIDAPQTLSGHTLIVSSGTFSENITVNKSVFIYGSGTESTILRANNSNVNAITITANCAVIKNLTIKDATGPGTAGIQLQSVSNVIIDSCSLTNNFCGIQLASSSDNTISNSRIMSNIENGIALISSSNRNRITTNTVANTVGGVGDGTGNGINIGDQSSSNTIIEDNLVYGNYHAGIIGYAGSNNMQIRKNIIHSNGGAGIHLGWSSGCVVEDNEIYSNTDGILIDTAPDNIFRNNRIRNNSQVGIGLWGLGQTNNVIQFNIIANNGSFGIHIGSSTRNTIIRDNTISGNAGGAKIQNNPGYQNYGNKFYNNNFISNAIPAEDSSPEPDYWDNGLPHGGNYWDNWVTPDSNGDSFVDNPYQISGGYSQDNYPYVSQIRWLPEITTTTLRQGVIHQSYLDTLKAEGGIPPYTWSIKSGSLPTGIVLNANGVISGIPTTTGLFNLTIQVHDSRTPPLYNAKDFSIAVISQPQITTVSLLQGTAGYVYIDTLRAINGILPYKWSITSGSLPQGLRVDSLTGIISGIPTNVGRSTFTIQVKDAGNATDNKELSIDIVVTSTFTSQLQVYEGYNPNVAYDVKRQILNIVCETDIGKISLLQSTNGGENFLLKGNIVTSSNIVEHPSITIDNEGNIGIVWLQADPDAYNVYFKRSNDGGATFGSAIKVNDVPASSLSRPKIVSFGSIIYIVWDSDNNKIFIDKTTDGITFGTDVQVNSPGGVHVSPAIAMSEDGVVHIAWQGRWEWQWQIWYSKSIDSARTFSANLRVDNSPIYDNRYPAISSKGNYVYIAWVDSREIYSDIRIAVSNNSGITFGNSVIINDNSNNTDQTFPQVSIDASGGLNVIWQDGRNDNGTPGIYFARSTDYGVSFSTHQKVNTSSGTSGYGHGRPSLATTGNTIWACWQGTKGTGSTWYAYFSKASFETSVTSVKEQRSENVPSGFVLYQNYPNPFNLVTNISFSIPSICFVILKVYDIMGREVATLISEELPSGKHTKQWKVEGFASGIYFYRLQAGIHYETKKLILLQ